jgi:hypothetical protein
MLLGEFRKRNKQGVAEGSLNEYAVSGGGNDGNDSLFNYAKMWYNGNLKTQHQVEKALQKVGLNIGENEDENGGAYISDATGDHYESWTQEDLKQGTSEDHSSVGREGTGTMTKPGFGGQGQYTDQPNWRGYNIGENKLVPIGKDLEIKMTQAVLKLMENSLK